MEYTRDPKGTIQADLAYRLGKVLETYHINLEGKEDEYEVTLTISVLQTLTTNCLELIRSMSRSKRRHTPFQNTIPEEDNITNLFNIPKESIIENTLILGDLTIEKVLGELRNALSHPTGLNLSNDLLSTGYTTIDESKKIEKVVFVASPDVTNKNKTKYIPESRINDILDELKKHNTTDNFSLIEGGERNKKKVYALMKNEKSFHRIFRIELSPKQLLNLAYALASYLSQPLNAQGKEFNIEFKTAIA